MESGIGISAWGRSSASILILFGTILTAGVTLEVLVDSRLLSSTFIPAPSSVLAAIPSAVFGSALPLAETLGEVGLAFIISLAVGVSFGLLMGESSYFYRSSSGFVSVIFSTPKVIFLPLMLVWFGLTFRAVVIFAILEAALPVALLVSGAVRDVDREIIRVGVSMGASGSQMQRKIILPALMPSMLSVMQVALVFSVIGVLLSQMYLGVGGVGAILANDAYQLRTVELYAIATFFAVIVVAILWVIRYFTGKSVLAWHRSLSD